MAWDEWVKTAKEKGIPGEEFLECFQAKVERVKKEARRYVEMAGVAFSQVSGRTIFVKSTLGA